MLALLFRAALAALIQQPGAAQAAPAAVAQPAEGEAVLDFVDVHRGGGGQPLTLRAFVQPAAVQLAARFQNPGPIEKLAFSPDGSRLATTDDYGTVRLWDTRSGIRSLALVGQTDPTGSATNGKVVFNTGNLAIGPDGNLSTTVTFAPDGRGLASPERLQALVQLMGSQDDGLGATLADLDPALRTQLKLGDKCQGVAITSIAPGGPAEKVGLKVNDILLSLGDHPINAPADLATHLKAVGEHAVDLRIIREGHAQSIAVKPQTRVTLAPAEPPKPQYYLGVQAAQVADLVRVHLKLPEGQGLAVNEVIDDSPAKRAGLKTGDILLELDGKPLTNVETLMAQVQAVADKTAPLKLVREGAETQIPISPAPRATDETGNPNLVFFLADSQVPLQGLRLSNAVQGQPLAVDLSMALDATQLQGAGTAKLLELIQRRDALQVQTLSDLLQRRNAEAQQSAGSPAKSIEQLTREVEELKRAVEELRKSVDANRK